MSFQFKFRQGLGALNEGVGVWYDAAALIDADFLVNRYRFNGQLFGDETSWLAAIGGSKSGITRTIGPYVFGTELLPDGGFASGVDSWADGPATAANGDVSQVSNRLRMTYTGSGTGYTARRPTTTVVGRAYRYQATVPARSGGGISSSSVAAAANTDLNNGAAAAVNYGNSLPQTLSVTFGAQYTTSYFGLQSGGTASAANWVEVDDASVQECYPYQGFAIQALGARVAFTTPPTASGNKVLIEWSDNNTSRRSRVQAVFDATSHLRVIVTTDNTEYANLDLGVVGTSEAHDIALAATGGRFSASLDGTALVTDTSGIMPGVGILWIGRSASGDTWDGTITRVRVYPSALADAALTDPLKSLYTFGDSLSFGTGASTAAARWYNVLATAYTPDRTGMSAGVGGETTAQMLARVQADTDHRNWTTIFMDRPNSNAETDWIANMKAAAALLTTNRWLVIPPVLNSPSGQPDPSGTIIGTIQAALLSDPFFVGHTFDATQQAAYIAEMNDDATRVVTGSDYTHFNDTGHALQAARIKTTLDALGW